MCIRDSRLSDQGAVAPTVVVSRNDDFGAGHPAFLDDQRFLYRSQDKDGALSIRLGSLNSNDTRLVVDKVETAPMVATTPSGKSYVLYLKESELVSHELDLKSGTVPVSYTHLRAHET